MNKIIPLFLMMMVIGQVACNKKAENALENTEYKNDPGKLPGKPKVLYLIIDGARGLSVRDLKPPTIWKMRDSAVYTWNGISDSAIVDGGNWANMLAGVRAVKHGVNGNDYTNSKLDVYPSFFQRIKEASPGMRTAAFCASADLSAKIIGGGATENKPLASDALVKDAVIAELKKDEATVVMGQFHGVATAGDQFGYDVSKPEYANAILQVDGFVKEIMQAMYARKTYADERWMVVVSSSRGGTWTMDPEDSTAMGNPKMNTFTLFFNSRFNSKVIVKPQDLRAPFEGKAIRFYGDGTGAAVRAQCVDATIGDAGSGSLTVEMKMKLNKGSNNNYQFSYPPFFSKTANRSNSTIGWAFFKSGAGTNLFLADGNLNIQVESLKNTNDGNWHTYTAVINRSGNTYYASLFIDGENKKTKTLTSSIDITSPAPLTLGFNPTTFGNTIDGYIADVKIWNTAIPDEIIKLWAPRTYINKDHIYYDNLIGYWPCLDGSGNRLKDYSKTKKDMLLQNNYQWTAFSDLSDYLFPNVQDATKYVPNTLDIPYQVLEWLNIKREDSWKLDGHSWPAEYRDFPVYVN